jgi:hypothetical protein
MQLSNCSCFSLHMEKNRSLVQPLRHVLHSKSRSAQLLLAAPSTKFLAALAFESSLREDSFSFSISSSSLRFRALEEEKRVLLTLTLTLVQFAADLIADTIYSYLLFEQLEVVKVAKSCFSSGANPT